MILPFFYRLPQVGPAALDTNAAADAIRSPPASNDNAKGLLSVVKTGDRLKVYEDGSEIPISSLPPYYQLKACLLEEGQTTVIPDDVDYQQAKVEVGNGFQQNQRQNYYAPNPNTEVTILFGEFRIVSISMLHNILIQLRIAAWKKEGDDFHRTEQLPFFSRVLDEDVEQEFKKIIDEIFPADKRQEWYGLTKKLLGASTVNELRETLLDSVRAATVHTATEAQVMIAKGDLDSSPTTGDKPLVDTIQFFTVTSHDNPDRVEISWKETYGQNFLHALITVGDVLRNKEQDPDFATNVVFYVGQYLISQGQAPFNPYRSRFLGTVGFRAVTQTYCSLTDPGEGHIFATTRKERWMKGAIIHCEHLERPAGFDREQIESYRFPSILDFARIRLYTGYAAPSTLFVGRALRDDNDFYRDFIKVVNTTSSAATAAFSLGAAECKVSMSRLKSREMVAYMRALSGHTLKNYRQYFSAAFNINDPFYDDLEPQSPHIQDKKAIGLRGIELAALGGFNKVTWDGAADTYPSKCILIQLGFPVALEFVHKAHSAGLVTYFSAGFKLEHIPEAVFTGVDGIGIGGAQVLRIMDKKTGMHGPYTEEKLDGIIATRDGAAAAPRGEIAALLARLDQMYFEGTITKDEMGLRDETYTTALTTDDDKIKTLLANPLAVAVMARPSDLEYPWKGRANRLLRDDGVPLLKAYSGRDLLWFRFVVGLKTILASETKVPDVEGAIHSYSLSEPWKTLRIQYREGLEKDYPGTVPKYFAGEIDVYLKIEPISPLAEADLKESGTKY